MRKLLAALILLLSSSAIAQGPMGGSASLPKPASDGQCLVSSGGKWVAGACSGATSSNWSAIVPGGGTIGTGTFNVGAGSTLTTTGSGVINANQFLGVTSVSATEFGYLDGVTSAIQTQLDAKLATSALDAALVVSKFGSGSCSGYLKSDGTCDAGAGGSMVYPGAGVPKSTGSAWDTSYTVGTAANNLVQLDSLGKLPAVDGSQLTNLPSGSGTVNAGTQYQFGYYATTGTGISGNSRLTENSGGTTLTYSGTLGVSAVKFTSTDTVNNGQFDWQAGSSGDTTCATAASAHVLGCYRNNEFEVSNNGDAYSKVLRASDLTVANVVTAASPAGAANQVVISGGADKTVSYVTADTTTTHVLAATAGAPAFRALATTDLPATSNIRSIGCGMGSPTSSTALTTSETCYVVVPYACTIAGWNILVDAGTATVKTWRVATGTAIPTVTDSINTSGVSISTGTAVHSTTVTDFTSTAISANDIVAFNLSAVATAKFVYFSLQCNQ